MRNRLLLRKRTLVSAALVSALLLTLGTSVLAANAGPDVGVQWVEAMKKGDGRGAAKVSVETGFKYGADGKDQVISKNLARHFGKVFRKLRKDFKDSQQESAECTAVGRELGYMAMEWKETNEDISNWIRDIPEQFCTGEGMHPPKFHLLKKLGGELPHALLVVTQGEDPKVVGAYHF